MCFNFSRNDNNLVFMAVCPSSKQCHPFNNLNLNLNLPVPLGRIQHEEPTQRSDPKTETESIGMIPEIIPNKPNARSSHESNPPFDRNIPFHILLALS
jgi:hypothetical protein